MCGGVGPHSVWWGVTACIHMVWSKLVFYSFLTSHFAMTNKYVKKFWLPHASFKLEKKVKDIQTDKCASLH